MTAATKLALEIVRLHVGEQALLLGVQPSARRVHAMDKFIKCFECEIST
jgi:hypothetical protein